METIFLEITIIICLATVLAIIFRLLKQPPILAYILTGIILGPFGKVQFPNLSNLNLFAQLGITLVLFMLGLELKLKGLRSVGLSSLIIGTLQVIFTFAAGYILSLLLHFSIITSLYIGIALTFSSTIIIVKLLSDKRDLGSLSGKISVGILILHNLVAVLVIMLLAAFNKENILLAQDVAIVLLKGGVLVFGILFVSRVILPKIIHIIAKSQEMLFLFSLAWVFGLSAAVSSSIIGFPIEIGGFLAGLSLADSTENFQIAAKVRALRDFFLTIFFVTLGMRIEFESLQRLLIPIIVLSLFILIAKPAIMIFIMSILRYRKRTSFLAGLNMAQISEFSFIVVFLGNRMGHLPNDIVSLSTVLGLTTFVLSTYMISGGNTLYKFFGPYIKIFERKVTIKENDNSTERNLKALDNHVILIGGHRIGKSMLRALGNKENIVVVDFDPDIIRSLGDEGILNVFGDIADVDIQERVNLQKAKIIISTVPDIEDNLLLLQSLKNFKDKKVLVVAQDVNEAKALYDAGAYYVILPHISSGRHLAKIIKGELPEKIEEFKKQDLALLS